MTMCFLHKRMLIRISRILVRTEWGIILAGRTLRVAIYSKINYQKSAAGFNTVNRAASNEYMKKLLLLSAVLLGAVTASQAGVHFSIGIPFPAPPVVVAPPVLEFGFRDRPYYRPYSYRPYYHRDYWRHDRDNH